MKKRSTAQPFEISLQKTDKEKSVVSNGKQSLENSNNIARYEDNVSESSKHKYDGCFSFALANFDQNENKVSIRPTDYDYKLLSQPDEKSASLLQQIMKFWNENVDTIIIKKGCFDQEKLE